MISNELVVLISSLSRAITEEEVEDWEELKRLVDKAIKANDVVRQIIVAGLPAL